MVLQTESLVENWNWQLYYMHFFFSDSKAINPHNHITVQDKNSGMF